MVAKELEFNLILYGKPKAQSRPRFSPRRNGSVYCYDKLASKKALDRTMIMSQLQKCGLRHKLDEPLEIEIIFHMGCPVAKRTMGLFGYPRPNTPDIDNLVKYYLDVMNDLVYKDDRVITDLSCRKVYSSKGSVEIKINTLREVKRDEKGNDV